MTEKQVRLFPRMGIELWWDKGILWIKFFDDLVGINSYEALELLQKLEAKCEEIESQAILDRAEGL